MLTLAFAQIVWAICFKWNELTGGEQGMPEIPYPDFAWVEKAAARAALPRRLPHVRVFLLHVPHPDRGGLWVLRRIVASPFGRMLTTIRRIPSARSSSASTCGATSLPPSPSPALRRPRRRIVRDLQSRSLPDFAYWTKSSEVLIMTLLAAWAPSWARASGPSSSSG
jgi:branched-chain amino acid transport system permease protein